MRTITIIVLLILAVPATLMAAPGDLRPAQVAARHSVAQPPAELRHATSDARTVGWVSMPFIILGLAVAAAYRRLVQLYQHWCLCRDLRAGAAPGETPQGASRLGHVKPL